MTEIKIIRNGLVIGGKLLIDTSAKVCSANLQTFGFHVNCSPELISLVQ